MKMNALTDACRDLKNAAINTITDLIGEYGKLMFMDGSWNPIYDFCVGPVDNETGCYPNLISVDEKGVHAESPFTGEETVYKFYDVDLSTDDLCCTAELGKKLVNSWFDVIVHGEKELKGVNYKTLLLIDALVESDEWEVTKVIEPEE